MPHLARADDPVILWGDARASRDARATLVLSAVLAAAVVLGPGAGSAHATTVTFIGDSKAAGIELSPRAKRLLARGHEMRRDLKVCRRS